MSTSEKAINFDSSLPKPYSNSWRQAYGQGTETPRLSSYQAPEGKPVYFVYDSIALSGGQNVDTAQYPYGYWSNTRLGEKPQSVSVKLHVIGEDYIKQRSELVSAFQVSTDDDNPGFLDLPLWGRFKVVILDWDVDEDKSKTGMSSFTLKVERAGYSNSKRFAEVAENLGDTNIANAIDNLKSAATDAFETAVEKSKDVTTLAQGFGELSKKLADVVGRVQGAVRIINSMINRINGITNLIAQAVMTPRLLAQAFVSAAFGIVAGIMDITNAFSETASYFMHDSDSASDSTSVNENSNSTSSKLSPRKQESVMQELIARNEKNVLFQFLSASTYKMDIEQITEQQYNTVSALENLYKTAAFGVCVQLLTRLDVEKQTYKEQAGLWNLLEKLEDSIDKENSAVFAAVEECRINCAKMLLSYSYDIELKKQIRKEMPLLELAIYLGCDAERIRSLNKVSDSFLIKGDVIYV